MATIYSGTIIEQNGVTYSGNSIGLNIERMINATSEGSGTRVVYQYGNTLLSILLTQSYTSVSVGIENYTAGQKVAMPYTAYQSGSGGNIILTGTILQDISDIFWIGVSPSGFALVSVIVNNVITVYTLSISQSAFIALCNASNTDTSVVKSLYSGTINLNETSDQIINMSAYGNTFLEINVILYSATENITTAKALQIWSGAAKSGTKYYSTVIGGVDSLQQLTSSSAWISVQDLDIVNTQSPKQVIPNILYLSLGTAQGTAAACSILITGIKIS